MATRALERGLSITVRKSMNIDGRSNSTSPTVRLERRNPRGFVFLMGLVLVGATVAAVVTMQMASQYHLQIF